MPIIKSAKKRMRQNVKRRARNFPVRNKMKTVFKTTLELIKDGKLKEAKEIMPRAFSIIDTACKKNIIPKNTAARRKSRLASALNALESKGGVKEAPVKKATAKATEAKAEKVEKTEEKEA